MTCFKSRDNRLSDRSEPHSGVNADHRLTPKVPAFVTGNAIVGGYCVIPIPAGIVPEVSLVGLNDESTVECCGKARDGIA